MPSTQLLKLMMMKMTSECHLMGCEVYLLFVISLDSCFLCYNSKMDFVFIFLKYLVFMLFEILARNAIGVFASVVIQVLV